jgi:hypothetical protein
MLCTRVSPKAWPTAVITATLPPISSAMASTMVLILAKKSGTEISMPTAGRVCGGWMARAR